MKLKLKVPLASQVYGNLEKDAVIEVKDPAECQRLVIRQLAELADPKDKLPAISEAERQAILDGRVVVTRRKGWPIEGDPCGNRTWAGLYRPATAEDRRPRARGERPKSPRPRLRAKQERAYGPPRATVPVEAK